jgi:hypothetical protein
VIPVLKVQKANEELLEILVQLAQQGHREIPEQLDLKELKDQLVLKVQQDLPELLEQLVFRG